ncbi:uncharacterized protein [Typha angustifolia]|uniref:uncharacterized protein n=1 Tax=Typha angustifolia TaxID=59011 RepID=UPI003C2B5AD0
MQQRKIASGRPSGTDGSDYSYRMVVDSRYTKVAKGKSRLGTLLVAQTINQVIGFLWVFLSTQQIEEINKPEILSISIGLISLVIGELGRRRSQVILLRLYIILSSVAIASTVACLIRSGSFVKVIHYHMKVMMNSELFGTIHVFLGVLLQVIVIFTTVALVRNMSPKRVP